MNDHKDQDREFDMGVESLSLNEGRGYQERERDPPSKPRAMHQDAVVTSPAYAPVGPSNLKYRDRPSPPHLSVSDSRRDLDNRSGPPPPAWQERRDDRREDKPYVPTPDRPVSRFRSPFCSRYLLSFKQPVREPRGRPAPASSANSIPIGTRRAFVPEPPVNDYPPSATNDRYERPSYPANDVPRQTRNHEQDHPRPYVQEPVPETRQGYPKVPRNDPQVAIDNRSRRMDKPEVNLAHQLSHIVLTLFSLFHEIQRLCQVSRKISLDSSVRVTSQVLETWVFSCMPWYLSLYLTFFR
jgi:hypothetical protein